MIGTTKVSFTGVHRHRLAGLLTLPTEYPAGFALFAHCFTCGKDSHAAARISRALAERGYGVLRFDVTGLGESEGDFADVTFSCDVSDLALAADYLRTHHRAPDLLVGHSLGGAAVIAAAHRIPEARAVVTIGAPSDPAHVVDLFTGSLAELEESGSAPVMLGSRTFTIRRSFLDDIREQPQAQRIAILDRALLVMHAPGDTTVRIDNARRIYDAARHPKSFVTLEGADHLLSKPADSAYAAEVIAAWASRYIELDHAPTTPTTPTPPTGSAPTVDAGTVVVTSTDAGKYARRVTAGDHVLIADEPEPVGGDDSRR